MTTLFMPITDEAEWLAKKKNYITSTQVSALFGLSQYNTAYELYHITRGHIEEAREENNFMKFGKILEAPICDMIKLEHPEWIIEPFALFAHNDEDKIGSSFDRVVTIDGKLYLLELKSISYRQYKEKFVEHSREDIEASPHYECQMMNELELVKDTTVEGQPFAGIVMAVFILDTRELRYIFRKYDAEMGNALRDAVKEFWAMTEPPAPDFARDKKLIAKLCTQLDPNKQLDATEDQEITELAAQYRLSKDLIKTETEAADKAYAELIMKIGDARYIWTEHHKISVSVVKGKNGESKRLTIKAIGKEEDDE